MDPAQWIETLLLSVTGSAIGAYFTTRAKNLATHDDLDKLVDQVRAVTRETELIKAEIGEKTEAIKVEIAGGLWDRQKRWEAQRDILLEFMRSAGRVDSSFRDLLSWYKVRPQEADKQQAWQAGHIEATTKWLERTSEFDGAIGLLHIVAEKDLRVMSTKWIVLRTDILEKIRRGDPQYLGPSIPQLTESTFALYAAIRKELGIDEPHAVLGVENEA